MPKAFGTLLRYAQGAVDVLVSTAVGIDRERCVRVGHDGADGLGTRLEIRRPVERLGGGGVQLVVQLAEDADQTLLVDLALVCVEVFAPALLLEHVLERGHRQGVVGVEALCAVRVEVCPEVADRGLL